MTKITINSISDDADLAAAFNIRRRVFMDEMGVSEPVEFDGREGEGTVHYLARRGSEPAGCFRARFPDVETMILERFAILKPHRGKGVLEVMTEAMFALADEMKVLRIYGEAEERILKFHWLEQGFEKLKVDPVDKCGIRLYPIEYRFEPVLA